MKEGKCRDLLQLMTDNHPAHCQHALPALSCPYEAPLEVSSVPQLRDATWSLVLCSEGDIRTTVQPQVLALSYPSLMERMGVPAALKVKPQKSDTQKMWHPENMAPSKPQAQSPAPAPTSSATSLSPAQAVCRGISPSWGPWAPQPPHGDGALLALNVVPPPPPPAFPPRTFFRKLCLSHELVRSFRGRDVLQRAQQSLRLSTPRLRRTPGPGDVLLKSIKARQLWQCSKVICHGTTALMMYLHNISKPHHSDYVLIQYIKTPLFWWCTVIIHQSTGGLLMCYYRTSNSCQSGAALSCNGHSEDSNKIKLIL